MAKKGSNFDPSSTDAINNAKIVAQRSTISSQWLTQTYPNSKPQLYDTLDNAFIDLGNERADAMISDKLPALTWLSSDLGQNFEIKGGDININDKVSIAVDKGNTALLQKNSMRLWLQSRLMAPINKLSLSTLVKQVCQLILNNE